MEKKPKAASQDISLLLSAHLSLSLAAAKFAAALVKCYNGYLGF